MSALYLYVDLGAIAIPFLFSFHPKLQFYKKLLPFFLANLLSMIPFLIWDMYFTKLEIWGFNPVYLTGLYIGNLPLEEILFFFCIPYACVFTWHCFHQLGMQENSYLISRKGHLFIAICSLIIALVFWEQWYTRYTFVFLTLLISLSGYLQQKLLGRILLVYSVLLIPFFIVNGILTGTGIENEIVWYNDFHNFGIRMSTIPVEDTFYGLGLIALNIYLFEYFKKLQIFR